MFGLFTQQQSFRSCSQSPLLSLDLQQCHLGEEGLGPDTELLKSMKINILTMRPL